MISMQENVRGKKAITQHRDFMFKYQRLSKAKESQRIYEVPYKASFPPLLLSCPSLEICTFRRAQNDHTGYVEG